MGFLDLISSNPVAPLVVLGFLGVMVFIRVVSRGMFRRAQGLATNVSVVASQYFKTSSREAVGADWATYRWAATNWGFKGVFRRFRAVFNLNRVNDPLFALINFMLPRQSTVELELRFKPQFEGYACVVKQKNVPDFIKQNQELITRFAQAKHEAQDSQMCESFVGLAKLLFNLFEQQIPRIQSVCLANDTLRAVFLVDSDAKVMSELTQLMFNAAEALMGFRLSPEQQRQNQKRIEAAIKLETKLKVQRQVEKDEQQVQDRIAEMNKQMQDDTVSAADKQKIKAKLDAMQAKERQRLQKQMAASLNMGSAHGGGKNQRVVVMK